MFGRIALGYVVALPAIVLWLTTAVSDPRTYTVAVTMASSVPGHLQVFFDGGRGFRELDSGTAWLETASGQHEYRLRLPAGTYPQFRLDPGTQPGQYTITRVAVLAPDGSTVVDLPLTTLAPVQQVTVLDRSAAQIVAAATPGGSDPQFLCVPSSPVRVPSLLRTPRVLRDIGVLILCWLAGIGVVSLAAWGARRWTLPRRLVTLVRLRAAASPRLFLGAVAVVATMLATYPVIVFGRSFVAPTNGFVRVLYDSPPLAAAARDTVIEETRNSDVGAAIYAFLPYTILQRQALTHGELPLWNRDNASGRPLWGQGQTFLFDPLHWLALLAPDVTTGWDLKLVVHRVLFAFGVGLVAWLVLGQLVPAVLVTVAAPFVSVYLFRLSHPAAFTLTYTPWMLLGWWRLARAATPAARFASAMRVAVSAALVLLSSPPKEAVVMLMGLVAVGLVTLLLAAGTWRERIRRLGAAAVAGVICLLVTAPHWLLFVDTLKLSMTSYDQPYAILGGRAGALSLFAAPLVPGDLQPGLNLLALVLLVAAAAAPWRLLKQPLLAGCAVVAAALLLVAFGAVPTAIWFRLPFLGNIGHVGDVFTTAAVPPLLLVAAAGASVLLSASRARALLVTAAVAVIVLLLVTQIARMTPTGQLAPFAVALFFVPAVCLPWSLATLSPWPSPVGSPALLGSDPGLTPVSERPRESPIPRLNGENPSIAGVGSDPGLTPVSGIPRAVSVIPGDGVTRGVVVLALAVALVAPAGVHLTVGRPLLDVLLIQPRPRTPLDAPSPATRAVRAATADEPGRVVGLDWWLHSGAQGLFGLEGIGGPDALELRTYEDLVDAGGIKRYWLWLTTVEQASLSRLEPLLDLLNVRFLLAGADATPPGFVDVPLAAPDRVRVGRRATAWPRAFFVDGVSTYRDAGDFMARVTAVRAPLAAVQENDRDAVERTRGLTTPVGLTIPASRYQLTVNASSFAITTPRAGVAVLTEAYLPGEFVATLNGQPVPYFRVNHAFKGVVIPGAGEWRVQFVHRPAHGGLSLAMAGCGVLLGAAFAYTARRRRYGVETASNEYPAARASS